MTPHEVMVYLLTRLGEAGLGATVISVAKTGTCYVAFNDPHMGKIRIGDHDERERYGYRWQIRLDIAKPYVDEEKGHRRYFYPGTKIGVLAAVSHMRNYDRAAIRRMAGDT